MELFKNFNNEISENLNFINLGDKVQKNNNTIIKYKIKDKNNYYDNEIKIYNEIKKRKITSCLYILNIDYNQQFFKIAFVPYNIEKIIEGKYNNLSLFDFNISKLIINILCGLNELHRNFITHGDFKLKNIQTFGKDDQNIKIIDFEFADYFEYLSCNEDIKEFEEKKTNDLNFAKRIIYQLIWNKKYGEICYKNKRESCINIYEEIPDLAPLLETKDYNIEKLIKYFVDAKNVFIIQAKLRNQFEENPFENNN